MTNLTKFPGSIKVVFRNAVAAVALLSAATGARASSFSYSGSIMTYTVAATGTYDIVGAGAQGGAGYQSAGGLGALLSGDYNLSAGTVLDVVVGGEGGLSSFGGGVNGGGGGGGWINRRAYGGGGAWVNRW